MHVYLLFYKITCLKMFDYKDIIVQISIDEQNLIIHLVSIC